MCLAFYDLGRKKINKTCQGLPIKLRYPSPPNPCVMSRIILCNAMPLSTISEGSDITDMWVYISLSINQKAIVLSPTNAYRSQQITNEM